MVKNIQNQIHPQIITKNSALVIYKYSTKTLHDQLSAAL